MASLNRVFIMGRLGQDPELRFTPNQTPVATLNVATTESWAGRDGQRQEQTEWHRVIVWGKQAENCSKYLAKGRAVFVEGRLQTRSWEDKNQQKRFTTEIVANTVQFMPSNAPSAGGGYGTERTESFPPPNQDPYGLGGGDPYGSPNTFSASTGFPPADKSPRKESHIPASEIDEIPF